jgi:hypothetical protein
MLAGLSLAIRLTDRRVQGSALTLGENRYISNLQATRAGDEI